jgi:hypothetical protein
MESSEYAPPSKNNTLDVAMSGGSGGAITSSGVLQDIVSSIQFLKVGRNPIDFEKLHHCVVEYYKAAGNNVPLANDVMLNKLKEILTMNPSSIRRDTSSSNTNSPRSPSSLSSVPIEDVIMR